MYAWYVCHYQVGALTEAELLVQHWMSRISILQGRPDSFDSVRELGRQIKVLPEKSALCFCCKGSGVLLGMEGAFRVSIDCYDAAWSGHLELEISIVWHRIESTECGSSEQCVIAAVKRDDVED